MDQVTSEEAKARLTLLLARVEAGEEIMIVRDGRPVAKLVPVGPLRREPGRLRGRVRISRDFDAPLPPSIA